jgi:hypothetical protein
VSAVFIEYHLFRTKPLEKCHGDIEEAQLPNDVDEAVHVVSNLRSRIVAETQKSNESVMGYAYVDKKPAVLIRADGSLHLLERYSLSGKRILSFLQARKVA